MFFLEPNFFFQTQNLFMFSIFSDPKICLAQNYLQWKTIFGGRKQSFRTWGFLNCQEQRFYFNWSLTQKTESCSFFFLSFFGGGRGGEWGEGPDGIGRKWGGDVYVPSLLILFNFGSHFDQQKKYCICSVKFQRFILAIDSEIHFL